MAPHENPSDPAVASIGELLDEDVVLDICKAQLTRCSPEERSTWCLAKRIETLYDPGQSIRVVYVLLHDADTPTNRFWPVGQLIYLRAPARHSVSHRGELIRIGESEIEAYAFPNDRRLRSIRRFARRDSCLDTWQQWLKSSGSKAIIQHESIQRLLVRYVPEQKWIVRLRAEIEEADHSVEKQRMAVRASTPKVTKALMERHISLSATSNDGSIGFRIPTIIGADISDGILGVEWIRGNNLIEAINADKPAPILNGVATRLNSLHQQHIRGLPPQSKTELVNRFGSAITDLSMISPSKQQELKMLAYKSIAAHDRVDQSHETATIHNDFHWGQLSIKRDRYALFDFDRMAIGDPLLDIANFSSQLQMLGHRPELKVDHNTANHWSEIFLEAWERVTKKPIDRIRLGCYAAQSRLDLARGMMRHLRPGWKDLADRCIEHAQSDLSDC